MGYQRLIYVYRRCKKYLPIKVVVVTDPLVGMTVSNQLHELKNFQKVMMMIWYDDDDDDE